MESKLKATKSKREFLEVYYKGSILDAEKAIQKAISEQGLDRNRVTVICYPESMKTDQSAMERNCIEGRHYE